MLIGLGTVTNVVTVLLGTALGVGLGHRLSERTRATVTDVLGLITVVIGGLTVIDVTSAELADAVGGSAGLLVVLFSLLFGGLLGSWLRIEERVDIFAGWLTDRIAHRGGGLDDAGKHRFATGFVTATLVYCVGPLAILGSLSDGLGRGPQQLVVKALLDGFASVAFAASFGWGVAASILPLALYQGTLTLLGWLLGDFLPKAHIDALSATGGIILLGLGLRLLDVKAVRVADLLPALVVAPLLVQALVLLR